MIIITGYGRCGTSIVALICKELGYDPGGYWIDNIDAGMENEAARDLDILLTNHLNHPELFPEMLECEHVIRKIESEHRVIKDPRIFDVRLMQVWHKHLQELKVLLLMRNFDTMRESRYAKNIGKEVFGGPEYATGMLITYFLEKKIDFRLLYYPYCLEEPSLLMKALVKLGLSIDWNKGIETINRLYQPDKVHFKDQGKVIK